MKKARKDIIKTVMGRGNGELMAMVRQCLRGQKSGFKKAETMVRPINAPMVIWIPSHDSPAGPVSLDLWAYFDRIDIRPAGSDNYPEMTARVYGIKDIRMGAHKWTPVNDDAKEHFFNFDGVSCTVYLGREALKRRWESLPFKEDYDEDKLQY